MLLSPLSRHCQWRFAITRIILNCFCKRKLIIFVPFSVFFYNYCFNWFPNNLVLVSFTATQCPYLPAAPASQPVPWDGVVTLKNDGIWWTGKCLGENNLGRKN
jgi:hypothetical protein